MSNKGFTLIELLTVITVTAILVIGLSFEYVGWQGKYKVESQIKDIFSDVMEARVRAMRVKRVHFISLLDTNTYTMYDDDADGTNPVPDGDSVLQTGGARADTQIRSFPKTVEYDMSWNNVDVAAVQDLGFNTRGLAINPGTISFSLDRDANGVKDFEPDYDCIVIRPTRINLGQINTQGTAARADDVCTEK